MNLCLWSFQYILYVVIIVRIFSNKLIERHTERIQRLLARKREKLTAKYLGELIERVEIAQKEADLEEEMPHMRTHRRLPVRLSPLSDRRLRD